MLKRYGQIIEVLRKYGFGYIVDQIGLSSFGDFTSRFKKQKTIDECKISSPVRVRKILEELGPTYIKLGQLLSMRRDLIPLEYAAEFSKLQDDAPSFGFEQVELIIREELGHPVEELFYSFEKKPLASASIGQVHRAKLKNSDYVVVKVQRPGITEVIKSDLDIMYSIARLLTERIPEARLYRPVELVDELSRSILAEIDYEQEGWNADRFAENFKDNEQIHIPKVYWDHTSTRVLTLEYIVGTKGGRVDLLEKRGFDRREIALTVAGSFLKQVFKDGFFHADLHPGNIMIMEDGKIAFLDFGMIGYLSEKTRTMFLSGMMAFIRGDSSHFIEILRDVGGIDSYVDTKALEMDFDYFRSKYYGRSLKNLNASEIIDELTGILRKNQVKVPYNITLLVRGTLAVEGFVLMLDPDLNITELVEPYAKKAIIESFYPQHIARVLYDNVSSWSRVFQKAPDKISHILDIAESGYVGIRLETEEIDLLISQVNTISNRLSFSLLVSSIIVASSLIAQTDMKPTLGGVPLLGVLGFLLAGIFGMWLVFSIFKTGKI
jgi:ubiquinone biosynthesis protein